MIYELPTVEVLAPVSVFLNPFFNEALKPDDQIDWRVRKLKQFIESSKGSTTWDLNKICEHLNLHISGNYAAQLFRQSIGMGWRQYAARYRLASVAERLKATSNSVKEIALEFGYRRAQDLSRGFRKTYQLTPKQYRHLYHLLDVMWPAEERSAQSYPKKADE